MSLKIVAISDIHNRFPALKLPKGDVLVCAGDLTGRGEMNEINLFCRWLDDQDFDHKIVVAGNHDWGFVHHPELAKDAVKKAGATYLENSEVVIDGIKFWGSPWTPWFYDWAFNGRTEQLKRIWDSIPDDTDVLITHGPPYGILDVNMEKERCGCPLLLEAVKRVKPQLHLFGHIHEGWGVIPPVPASNFPETTFANCAVVNRNYELRSHGWTLEITGPKKPSV